jgi:hypothetical protein
MEEMVCRGDTVLTVDSALSATADVAGVEYVAAAFVLEGVARPGGLGLEMAVDGRPPPLLLSRRRFGASLIFGWV